MWSDPLPGGGTRISFCIPAREGERLEMPPVGAGLIGPSGGGAADRPGVSSAAGDSTACAKPSRDRRFARRRELLGRRCAPHRFLGFNSTSGPPPLAVHPGDGGRSGPGLRAEQLERRARRLRVGCRGGFVASPRTGDWSDIDGIEWGCRRRGSTPRGSAFPPTSTTSPRTGRCCPRLHRDPPNCREQSHAGLSQPRAHVDLDPVRRSLRWPRVRGCAGEAPSNAVGLLRGGAGLRSRARDGVPEQRPLRGGGGASPAGRPGSLLQRLWADAVRRRRHPRFRLPSRAPDRRRLPERSSPRAPLDERGPHHRRRPPASRGCRPRPPSPELRHVGRPRGTPSAIPCRAPGRTSRS